MRGVSRLLALGATAMLASGPACGPITYLSRATFGADSELTEMRATNAPTMAPYEFTAATEYLRRAQELAGYARFQDANHFAKQAQDHAAQGKKVRDRRNKNDELPIYDPKDPSLYVTQDGAVKKKSGDEAKSAEPKGPESAKPLQSPDNQAQTSLDKGGGK